MTGSAKKPGFTLIEVIIFVALASIVYVGISKMIPKRRPVDGVKELFMGLNNLTAMACQEAVLKQLPARLDFKVSKKRGLVNVSAKIFDPAKSDQKNRVFKKIDGGFVNSKFEFPKNIELVRWWTDSGKSSSDLDGLKVNISPDGFSQIAIFHLVEMNDYEKKNLSAITNPFMGEFKKVSGFLRIPKSDSEQAK